MACEDRRADLVGYLYGELDGRERRAIQEHLDACDDCASELAELAASRAALRTAREAEAPWTVPASSESEPGRAAAASPGARGFLDILRSWWRGSFAMPRWAFAGAAVGFAALVVVASELDVTRNGSAFVVSWGSARHGGGAGGASSLAAASPMDRGLPGASGDISGAGTRAASAVRSQEGQALLAEVGRMLEASEKRQTASTAQLVDALGVQYARQYETGRRQDLQLVDYWIGSLSGKTQAEFTRTNQQLRDMAELIMVSQGQGAAWPGSRGVPVVREGRLEPGSPVVAPADSQGIGQGTGGR